jgi:multiple sugar transport system permease protein
VEVGRTAVSHTRGIQVGESLWAYGFLAPFFIGLVAFVVGPVIAALLMSFTHWDLASPPVWVGSQNYNELIRDHVFWTSLANTFYFTFVSVPTTLILALFFATLLNRRIAGREFFRAVYFAPATTSIVALSLLWAWMYSPDFGIINYTLYKAHLTAVRWLADPVWAMPSVIIMSIWRSLGFNIVVFLAGLQAIDRGLFEAAEIDGANPWRKFLHVTVPLLSPTLFFATVMALITSFQVFEQTFIMTQGGPGNATMTLVYYIFQTGFTYLRMGYAAAVSFALFLVVLIMTIVQLRLQRRWVHYE